MRSMIAVVFTIALVVFLSGCCLRFSDLTPGATYDVGDTITTSGTDIVVEQFQWANGNWTSSGLAKVDTRNYAHGSGNDLNANNVNLHFRFDYPIDKITFKFGELGGNNNIKVNGDFENVHDLVGSNGTTIGGVQATVDAYQQGNNWFGKMILDGSISDFSIGGQELWLDDVCPRK